MNTSAQRVNQSKKCSSCKQEKLLIEYSKEKRTKDGYRSRCKKCISKKDSVYRKRSKQKRKEYDIKFREENKEYFKNYHKSYYQKNRNKIIEYGKEYRKQNKQALAAKKVEYNQKNRKKKAEHERNRYKTDILYYLKKSFRRSTLLSFKRNGFSKKSKTFQILGCSYEDFKSHIEKQFQEGMTWNNRGKVWHLDHIIPHSLGITKEEIVSLNHYKNFQPLFAKDNIKKSNKIEFKTLKKELKQRYKIIIERQVNDRK